MRRLAVVGVLVAGLVAAACGGKDEPLGPTATLPSATTTTDPYAVPEVIDEAYVNRVLAGLDHAMGDIVRLVVDTKSVPPEAIERLGALYANETLIDLTVQLLEEDLRQGFPGLRSPPGNAISAVTDLLTASERCVFAGIDRDYSASNVSLADASYHQWIAVRRAATSPTALNPTGWKYIYDGFEPGGGQPGDPCEGS